ncbi:hypothetical protein [Herbaspirillum sp. C7C8]|uniref:hypothetical protein n=1 Tax=Herbaspirillum sp. C7C8 TaxID=2736665 RepID=UPI001F519C75|nr:hypothetical protein [Herbaspirillum sp. C7C8]MCI1006831.1 hypothetical protein [Herbaspirillum sp. C7C8]
MASTDKKKVRGAGGKRLAMRERLWPELDEEQLWLRKDRVGFTTIPRTMSLIGRIMDQLSGKGFPLFGTYLALWGRVYDEAFVEIRNEREVAFEAGFSGPRGEVTWRGRMRRLQELGFIDIRAGLASEVQYILIWNPILVIANKYASENIKIDVAYNALMARLIDVGATDLDYEL